MLKQRRKNLWLYQNEREKRFILLEGLTWAIIRQNDFCDLLDIPKFDSLFNIIGRDKRKLIEVKVSTNIDRSIETWRLKSGQQLAYMALVVVNPRDGSLHVENHPGDFTGAEKIVNFISLRSAKMEELELIDSFVNTAAFKMGDVFTCKNFNQLIEDFT